MTQLLRPVLLSEKIRQTVSLSNKFVTKYQSCASFSILQHPAICGRTVVNGQSTTQCKYFLQCEPFPPSHVSSVRRFSLEYFYSAQFPPVAAGVNLFTTIHDVSGLPWWLSLMGTALMVNLCLSFPMAVMGERTHARLAKLMPEIKEKRETLKREVDHARVAKGWSAKTAKREFYVNMKRIQSELFIRDNCHPYKTGVGTLLQLPLLITLTVALRNMCGGLMQAGSVPVLRPDLGREGVLWFSNLLLIDPLYILPAITVITNLINMQLQTRLRAANTSSRIMRGSKYLGRGFLLILIPLAAYVPSCFYLYWATSAVYTLTQNVVLLFPKVRRAVNIPELPTESKTPIQDMVKSAKKKLTSRDSS